MKVVIIEDEAVAARRLIRLMEEEGLEVVIHLSSLSEVRIYLDQGSEPDLFFMDIHLNDGIIFEIFDEREINAPIIFTTAYDQYAIKAFKQNSIDYLLKPIQEDELKNAIGQYKKNREPQLDLSVLSNLLLSEKNEITYRDRIRIKIGDRLKSIQIKDITHIYSDQKINFARDVEGRNYPIDYTIETIAKELDPKQFFRTSRSCIVNINHIKDVIAYSNSRLKIVMHHATSQEIIVAREKVREFKSWLG